MKIKLRKNRVQPSLYETGAMGEIPLGVSITFTFRHPIPLKGGAATLEEAIKDILTRHKGGYRKPSEDERVTLERYLERVRGLK